MNTNIQLGTSEFVETNGQLRELGVTGTIKLLTDRLAPMSNLGYANGWAETPAIVKNCERMAHGWVTRQIGRCEREHSCPICNYRFKVDSSG